MTTVAQAETNRTVAQAEASRVNGAKSRGPASAEGRERSRWNALRHGLAAEKVVVPAEEAEEFEAYREAFFDDERPTGVIETSLIERIAVLSWRLRRAVEMEAGLVAADQWDAHKRQCEMDKRLPGREGKDWSPPSTLAVGRVLRRSMSGPNCPYDTVGRYERRVERGYFQAIRELRGLRKDQKGEGRGERGERRGLPGRSAAKPGDAGRGDAEKRTEEDTGTLSAIQTEAPALRSLGEAGSALSADGRFGDASMYGMSAPVGADLQPDPFARPDSGQAPPGKKKMTSWHYSSEYPGGCLVEERWVDVKNCGMRISDCGLKTASSGNESSPAAEADKPKCEIRNPQWIVPPAEMVAEGLLADDAVAPVTPQESPAQAPTSDGQNE